MQQIGKHKYNFYFNGYDFPKKKRVGYCGMYLASCSERFYYILSGFLTQGIANVLVFLYFFFFFGSESQVHDLAGKAKKGAVGIHKEN